MVKVKNFFKKIGLWFKNHAPSKRRIIQVYAALLYNANIKGFFTGKIYGGGSKNLCVPGMNCYSCPGAVAACPLGALQNSLASSNQHTPYYILGILGVLGLMLARTICGFLCPLGLGQELLHKIKTPKLKKSRFTRILSYFKYVLLVVLVIAIPLIYYGVPAFCKYVCPAGTFGGAFALLANPNNEGYYAMLGFLFSWKFLLLVAFIVLSIFIYRFFCRFICPLGAIYGFFNKIALIGVKLDRDKCVDCGLCLSTCQMDIRHVGDHECINCGACIPVCPTKAISWKGSQIFLKLTGAAQLETANGEEAAPSIAAIAASGTASASAEAQPVTNSSVSKAQIAAVQTAEGVFESAFAEEEKKVKRRGFWLQFTAWALAGAVLIAAIVYYNFLAPESSVVARAVGDKLPNTVTLQTYKSKGAQNDDGSYIESFSTIEHLDKVTVYNFWFTTCDPCVAELPHFNTVKEEYGDDIVMVAVHAPNGTSAETVQNFIDFEDKEHGKDSWSDYGIIFAQDTKEIDFYTQLGGRGAYPVTTIVNAQGVITCIKQGPMSADGLRAEIAKALGK